MRSAVFGISLATLTAVVAGPVALNATEDRGEPFFREGWKETPPETPVTQAHLSSADLILSRHGPDADSIKKSHHDDVPNDPWYVWSGSCRGGRWAISLRKKNALVDLSRGGPVRWRTRQSGGHVLKVILELDDGTWLVSDKGFGETPDWWVFTLDLRLLRWHRLDIRRIEAGTIVKEPDLRRVRSVGWTDLMIGQGSKGCTRVDWIEVHGQTTPEESQCRDEAS